MSSGPWKSDDGERIDILGRTLRVVGLVLCIVGFWQLIQGFLAAQNPAIPPAASWAFPAILAGIPIGVVCLVLSRIRQRRGRRRE